MPPDALSADYLVVGAGTAGAVVARRLVDAGARVLVLEAGGPATNPAIPDLLRMHELWHSAEDWDYSTVPQEHAGGRRLHLPRGRVLGGSHALNATIYVRGNPADYDHWAYLGNPGWGWRDVEPYFGRIERYPSGAGDKGTDGMLEICVADPVDPVQEAILRAAEQTGIPVNPDYNGETQDGVCRVQLTVADGRRQTSADAYLGPLSGRPQPTVVIGAPVRRVVVSGGRATGVELVRAGRQEYAHADEGVVLTAGAIGSPLLLQRSGIGSPETLRACGVPAVVDLPGVGRNLQDHWLVPVLFSAEKPIVHTPGLPHAQTQLFWRSAPGLPVPDLQPLHFSVPLYEPWMSGPDNGFSLMAGLIRPASVGELAITGPDVDDVPRIDPRVLSAGSDTDRLVAAVELCEQIGRAPALREWGAAQTYPSSADDRRDYVRRTVVTYHHQAGTCRMGLTETSVVDPELRVYGVDRLTVADASVMPTVPTGNTNAPTLLIAEKAADLVRGAPPPRARR